MRASVTIHIGRRLEKLYTFLKKKNPRRVQRTRVRWTAVLEEPPRSLMV